MTTVQDAIDLARTDLPDPNGTRWSDAVLMECVSKAESNIVLIMPHAYPIVEPMDMVIGAKQAIVGARKLLDVVCNTTGEAVTKIDKLSLDQFRPAWMNDTKTKVAKHWMYDERTPGIFMVYPPSDGTGGLEIIKSGIPDRHVSETENLFISASYLVPLTHLTLAFAFLRVAHSDPQSAALADKHEVRALQLLGLEGKITKGELVSADTDEGR